MGTPNTVLGRRLAFAMEKADKSQTELAKAAGISQATVAYIISGRIKRPKPETLSKIAELLGVSVEWLQDPADDFDDNLSRKYAEVPFYNGIPVWNKGKSQYDFACSVDESFAFPKK